MKTKYSINLKNTILQILKRNEYKIRHKMKKTQYLITSIRINPTNTNFDCMTSASRIYVQLRSLGESMGGGLWNRE